MEQLDLLWKYQEFDLIMDQHDQERKNHPLRHTLLKLKNYLIEQQGNLVKLDQEANAKTQYFDRIQGEYERMLNLLREEQNKVASGEYTTLQQLEQLEKEGMALREKAAHKEEELKRLILELDAFVKNLGDIGHKITRAKKEYAEAKVAYDKEVEKIQQAYNKVKEQRDQYTQKIDKALINKYKNIRSNRSPVISTLLQDRCGGCNMSLASLVLQNVKEKKRIIECENCGRFLYYDA